VSQKDKAVHVPCALSVDGRLVNESKDKANVFTDILKKSFNMRKIVILKMTKK
jgi:hypothetical protein